MQFLNGDDWTRVSLDYVHSRDGHLLRNSTYLAAHPRLYIEIHNANIFAALGGNMLLARAALQHAGWSVVTFTLLREPHDLARSYYGHFGLGGNPRHREHEAKLGLSASRFASAHAEFALCHVWGMPWLCRSPLESEPPRERAPEARWRRSSTTAIDSTAAASLTRLARGALPSNALETGARVLGEERYAPLRSTFDAFLAAIASGRAALTAECGLALRLDSDGMYPGCERAPFDALYRIECAWARLHAAAYEHDRELCARQLGEFETRLSHVDVVGITERWTESMLLVAREIGLRRLPRMRINVRASTARRAADAPKAVELSACSLELYARWNASFARRLGRADAEYNATLAQLLVTLSEGVVRDKGPGLRHHPASASQPASRPARLDAEAVRERYARKEARIAARIATLGDTTGHDGASAALLEKLRARKARIAALISRKSAGAAAAREATATLAAAAARGSQEAVTSRPNGTSIAESRAIVGEILAS